MDACPRSGGSAPRWSSRGSARPPQACAPRPSTPRSRCRATPCSDHREAHPLARVFPLLDDVLGQAARDCDAIMAVSDAAGQLLWVCGSPSVLRRAEAIGFIEGSNWDERLAGTNAPGMALALDELRPGDRRRALPPVGARLELRGDAHPRPHDPVAARRAGHHRGRRHRGPPDDGPGARGGAPRRGRARAREGSPGSARSGRPVERRPDVVLESLGRSHSLLDDRRRAPSGIRSGSAPGTARSSCCSRRRLAGLSGDELAVLLYQEDSSTSTLRAELNRLRHLLGDELLGVPPVPPDGRAQRRLARRRGPPGDRGRGGRAAPVPRDRCCRPRSRPGIVRLRENLDGVAAPGRARQPGAGPDVHLDPFGLGRRRLRHVAGAARRARAPVAAAAACSRASSPGSTGSSACRARTAGARGAPERCRNVVATCCRLTSVLFGTTTSKDYTMPHMQAAVVEGLGSKLDHRGSPGAGARTRRGTGEAHRQWRLPHRPPRRSRRLARQAHPTVHSRPRRRRRGRDAGRGRHRPCGRPARRQRLALLGLRRVRVLHHRLGDALRASAERGVQRRRLLRRVHARRRRVCRAHP